MPNAIKRYTKHSKGWHIQAIGQHDHYYRVRSSLMKRRPQNHLLKGHSISRLVDWDGIVSRHSSPADTCHALLIADPSNCCRAHGSSALITVLVEQLRSSSFACMQNDAGSCESQLLRYALLLFQ